ncbi:MAG: hypothetical protein ACREFD_06510 [Stellaceae bacterium]
MIESKRTKIESAKRTASEKFARNLERDADFWREKEKRDQAVVAKTARLRALRLAKEAEDRDTRAKEDAARHTAVTARATGRKSRKGGASVA